MDATGIVQECEAVNLYYSLCIVNVTHPHPTMNFLGSLVAFNSLWTDLYLMYYACLLVVCLSPAPLHRQQSVTLADVSLDKESVNVNKQATAPKRKFQ